MMVVPVVTLLLADYDVLVLIRPMLCVMRIISTFENTDKQKYIDVDNLWFLQECIIKIII